MNLLTSIIIFVLGTAVGSFLSVVIYRIQAEEKGIFMGRSICPACKKKLKWRHLFPILSWLFLRGKCAYCGKKISAHYLILELLTGLIFLAGFQQWNFITTIYSTNSITSSYLMQSYIIDWDMLETLLFYLVEFSFMIAILFYDLMHKEIPDQLSLPAIAIAIIGLFFFNFSTETAISMLTGGGMIFLFFLSQFIFSKGKWIGGGDLRLGALMGILLSTSGQFSGWMHGILGLVIAYLLGGIISLILLAQKKIHRKSTIAFGPFLVTSTIIVIFYGDQILDWYFNRTIY